jgi:biotin carboxyl carrier protein
MKLDLTIDGREERIELSPGKFRLGEGPEREVSVEIAQPGVYSVLMGGRSYDVSHDVSHAVSHGLRVDGAIVTVCGRRFEIDVRDPRRWNRRRAGGAHSGVQHVAAPMPGKVVRLLAAVGDRVEAGQGIAVVEAMKMQNEMKAARAGTVASISAKVGDAVTAGEVLATIE